MSEHGTGPVAKRGAGVTAVARRGELREWFAGEERLFKFDWCHLEDIEARTGIGMIAIWYRAFSKPPIWMLPEIKAVLLFGLIGGGESRGDAEALIAEFCTPETLIVVDIVARACVGVALFPDVAEDFAGAKRKKKVRRSDNPTGSRPGR